MKKYPRVNVDILVVKGNKILLGLLTRRWLYQGKQVYGVPGRDIRFGEKISDAVKRDIKEDLGCEPFTYQIIGVNANYALGNHYIGIGVIAKIKGKVQNRKPDDWETWEWFDQNNLPCNLFPSAQNLIRCYLDHKINVRE